MKFKAWDLGGHEQVRSFWKEYFIEADAIIFVLDASDRERMEEAKTVRLENNIERILLKHNIRNFIIY